MQHAASLAAPREGVFAVLASSARRLPDRHLSYIAAGAGVVALAAAALGIASWMLLAACYVAWCFAGWGLLFRQTQRRTGAWRALELGMVISAAVVFAILAAGLFFWVLGPRWVL